MRRYIIVFMLCLMAGGVLAQDAAEPSPQGIIHIPTGSIGNSPLVLNPLFCQTDLCEFVTPLMFPSLVETHPATGASQLASEDNFALLTDVQRNTDGESLTYMLRSDAVWSDGTPITAYDVFYSYLVIVENIGTEYRSSINDTIEAMIPVDDTTLVVFPVDTDCDVPLYANFPVIPAHMYEENFAEIVSSHFTANRQTVEALEEWLDADVISFSGLLGNQFSYDPTVTYGRYSYSGQSAQDYVRLTHVDGEQVLQTVQSNRGQSGIDAVIAGDIAYYENPPREQWTDLRNNPNVTTITYPTDTWYSIIFNFSDPFDPESYRDSEGEIQEQDPHPILINPDVRRAIQLGIDVQALVDVVLWGEGEILAGYSLPWSWTHDPALAPVSYDPELANQLLEEAGWRRVNPTGTRICIGCETAEDNTTLSLELLYNSGREIDTLTAELIAEQLRRIGVSVNTNSSPDPYAQSRAQSFDVTLVGQDWTLPTPIENAYFFSPENDVVNGGGNVGSYNNPDITALFNEARTVNNCDFDQRRELYYELERQVQADQPYAWLFTPYAMTVYHESIQHVETFPNRPLANIHEWSVWRMP